jgi:hypothetical protein
VRTVVRHDARAVEAAGETFAAAVAALPKFGQLAALDAWLVETARTAQPLDAIAGSAVPDAGAIAPGAIVTVQATIVTDGIPILLGAPATAGRAGSPGAFLVSPLF